MHHLKNLLDQAGRSIIAIDGPAGGGKSSLATYLASLYPVTVIKLDDFTGWQPDKAWREHFIETILQPLTEGASTLTFTPVSYWPDHKPDRVTITDISDIVLIEGTRSCSTGFRPYLSAGIFVETAAETCLARGIARDINNGYDESVVTKLWLEFQKQEQAYFEEDGVREYVTMCVSGEREFSKQIE